jgi:hypothetical protein
MGEVTELVLVLSGYEAIHATLGSTRRMKYTLYRVRKMSSKLHGADCDLSIPMGIWE